MKYVNVNEIAAKWNLSERSVRNYCAHGKIPGVILDGKTWRIPEDAVKPVRKKRAEKIANDILTRLKMEKEAGIPGGIYHKVQIELTYNSNHMEGSRLTHDQTRYIFETNTIGIQDEVVNVDDIVETAKPADVSGEMRNLLKRYNLSKQKTLKEIIQFHYEFEKIHPFQDGNGRVGRLIMFKECLRNGITPFIIEDDIKEFYYWGLKEWKNEQGYLMDTCLTAQDRFKVYMDYFGLEYRD